MKITREEFIEAVNWQFDCYRQSMLVLDKEQVFERAWHIAKMNALREYLTDFCEDAALYPHADTILFELYQFELKYDVPMWMTYDDISDMVTAYIAMVEKQRT